MLVAFYFSGRDGRPLAGTCSADCDKAAAGCVDACEAKFPNDPSTRVGCKLECTRTRASCEASCGK